MRKFFAKWKPMVRTIGTVFIAGCLGQLAVNAVVPLHVSVLKALAVAGAIAVLKWAVNALDPTYTSYGFVRRGSKV
jgi:hypothetical protein